MNKQQEEHLRAITRPKLGQLLALAALGDLCETAAESLDDNDMSLLGALQAEKEKKNPLIPDDHWKRLLVASACPGNVHALDEHRSIFLCLITGGNDPENTQDTICQYLFQHLNACFQCFETYTDVMQSFYLTCSNLRKDSEKLQKK